MVFSEDWMRKLHRRYGSLPDSERPKVYQIALDRDDRTHKKIEELAAILPECSRQRWAARLLDNPTEWLQTYHELIVGVKLKELDHNIEYERKMQFGDGTQTREKKPDWYVDGREEIPPFIVEVATKSSSQNAEVPDDMQPKLDQGPRRLWKQLRDKVGKYKTLIDQASPPFVVAMMPTDDSHLFREIFEDAIHGQPVAVSHCVAPGQWSVPMFSRIKNGLLHEDHPTLSALLWIEWGSPGQWDLYAYHNPKARYPLPPYAFTAQY